MTFFNLAPANAWHRFHHDLDRVLQSNLMANHGDSESVADWSPSVDIKELENEFILRADLPGVDPKDIDVSMADGSLTLSGERFNESHQESDGYQRVERVSGKFLRRFNLPESADAEGIRAESRHGVLEISIPKQAKLQPRRISVDVKTAAA